MEIITPQNLQIDWNNIPSQKSNGLTGFAITKEMTFQRFKIRQVTFSHDYLADHWCDKGHIIHVLLGELIIEYIDNSITTIKAGNSLVLGDNLLSHRAKCETETEVLIID